MFDLDLMDVLRIAVVFTIIVCAVFALAAIARVVLEMYAIPIGMP